MGCGTKCIKILLVILNVFFWLLGLGVLAVGVWIKVDKRVANIGEAINIGLSENVIEIVSWIFIGAGIFAFLVGFFGCCGAIRESRCLLGFYIFCLIVIFGAEFAVAVWVGIRFNSIEAKIRVEGTEWVKNQYDGESAVSKGFNYVQNEFCCCGVQSYEDYKGSKFIADSHPNAYYSPACCKTDPDSSSSSSSLKLNDEEVCKAQAIRLSSNNTAPPNYESSDEQCEPEFRPTGCLDSLKQWAQDHMVAFIAVGAGVAFTQVIIFILALCLCIKIGRDEK